MDHWTVGRVVAVLKINKNPVNVAGMARFGINPHKTLGISMPLLRSLAKQIGRNHALARSCWKTGIHEARILAALIDDPKEVTTKQMREWVCDFDSWDVCDQVCMNLFDKIPRAIEYALVWTSDNKEFVRRAGFALIASLAMHDKTASNRVFMRCFPAIRRAATDERNFVKKAVNWALRQIGKRNAILGTRAMRFVLELKAMDSSSARWIGSDAYRELSVRYSKSESA